MCVAIVKPANVDFPKELFEIAWRKNPHGGGFMYAKDGHVVVKKGFMTLDDMMAAYNAELPNFGGSPVVLHFRIKTHGPIAPDQTHPHVISDRLAFVHNGIISIQIPPASANSDTMEFNDRVLKHLPDGFTRDPIVMELIRGYVDPSRLVFLEGDGSITIVNEQSGHVDPQGRWHSNEGALAAVDPKYQWGEYDSIISARRDPDITKWETLPKKARKALLREEKKKGRTRKCKYCNIELRYHDEADVCQQCMKICATCGEKMDPRFEQYGIEICEKCMTDEERQEVAEIIQAEGEDEGYYADPRDVATTMTEMILEAESRWEQEAMNLSPDDYSMMMARAVKGYNEFTAWFRDNTEPALYIKLREALLDNGKESAVFDAGMNTLLRDEGEDDTDEPFGEGGSGGFGRGGGPTGGRGSGAERDPWETSEFNPPLSSDPVRLNPGSEKILLIS